MKSIKMHELLTVSYFLLTTGKSNFIVTRERVLAKECLINDVIKARKGLNPKNSDEFKIYALQT